MENTVLGKISNALYMSILHIYKHAMYRTVISEMMDMNETLSRDYRMNCNI